MTAGERGAVLVVDDEPTVLALVRHALSRAGYEVDTAVAGPEAVAKVSANPARFSAVLLDVSIPGVVAEDLFDGLRVMVPRMPIVIMSGLNTADLLDRFGTRSDVGFLPKPFDIDTLESVVLEAISPLF